MVQTRSKALLVKLLASMAIQEQEASSKAVPPTATSVPSPLSPSAPLAEFLLYNHFRGSVPDGLLAHQKEVADWDVDIAAYLNDKDSRKKVEALLHFTYRPYTDDGRGKNTIRSKTSITTTPTKTGQSGGSKSASDTRMDEWLWDVNMYHCWASSTHGRGLDRAHMLLPVACHGNQLIEQNICLIYGISKHPFPYHSRVFRMPLNKDTHSRFDAYCMFLLPSVEDLEIVKKRLYVMREFYKGKGDAETRGTWDQEADEKERPYSLQELGFMDPDYAYGTIHSYTILPSSAVTDEIVKGNACFSPSAENGVISTPFIPSLKCYSERAFRTVYSTLSPFAAVLQALVGLEIARQIDRLPQDLSDMSQAESFAPAVYEDFSFNGEQMKRVWEQRLTELGLLSFVQQQFHDRIEALFLLPPIIIEIMKLVKPPLEIRPWDPRAYYENRGRRNKESKSYDSSDGTNEKGKESGGAWKAVKEKLVKTSTK